MGGRLALVALVTSLPKSMFAQKTHLTSYFKLTEMKENSEGLKII